MAEFNSRDYANAYVIDRGFGHSHLFSVSDAYKYATRGTQHGGWHTPTPSDDDTFDTLDTYLCARASGCTERDAIAASLA